MKEWNWGIISGVTAFVLLLIPLGMNVFANIGDDESVRSNVYDEEENTRDDVYEEDIIPDEEDSTTNPVSSNDVDSEVNEEDEDKNRDDTSNDELDENEEEITEEEEEDLTPEYIDRIETEDTVTGDVYYIYYLHEDNADSYIDEDSRTIFLDNTREAYFSRGLLDSISDGDVILNHNGLQLQVPVHSMESFYRNHDQVMLSLTVPDHFPIYENPLSDLFFANLHGGSDYDWYYAESADGPIYLTFKVNPDEVNNWDNLVIKYMNDQFRFHEYDYQDLYWNPETGEVSATVYDWGIYAIYEMDDDSEVEPPVNKEKDYKIDTPVQLNELWDYETHYRAEDVKSFIITRDMTEYIEDDAKVTLSNEGIDLTISGKDLQELLKDHISGGEITLNRLTNKDKDYLSEVYEIGLNEYLTDKPIEKFVKPFTATFYVDPENVKDWNDLALRIIDEEGNVIDSQDAIIGFNKKTGEVTVSISKPGTYGIVEIPEDNSNASGKNEDKSNGDVNVNVDSNATAISNSNSDSTTDSKDEKANSESSTKDNTKDKETEKGTFGTLPATATNTFNFVAIGALLLLAGVFVYVWKKPTG